MDKVIINKKAFNTIISITPEEQATGLMYQAQPPPIMCFPFKEASVNKFWMKDTISPLDIIFCRDNKIISIAKGDPLSLKFVGPNSPSDLVVEMPLGSAKHFGIEVGNPVSLKYSLISMAKYLEENFLKVSEHIGA